MPPRASIQTRIVIPYVVLFLAATVLTVYATIEVTSRLVESRWRSRLVETAQLLGPGRLPEGALPTLGRILGADLVFMDRTGPTPARFLTSHEDADALAEAIRRHRAAGRLKLQALAQAGQGAARAATARFAGRAYRIYYTAVPGHGNANQPPVLFLLVPIEDLQQAKRSAAMPVVIVAVVSLALVLLIGAAVARRLSRPIREMAELTQRIAAGEFDRRVPVRGGDELAELARSFNRMGADLQESQSRLIRAERLAAIGELAAGVAHEIRNPLSAVRMNVQILRDGLPQDNADRDACMAVLGEIDRLELLVADLLEYARPREPALTDVDLTVVADDCLALMKHQLAHAKVKVQRDYDSEAPRVRADADKLKQVVMNLLVNAMNAMVRGGRIEVMVAQADHGVRLVVRDTGQGIDPAVADRLFDPFVTTRAKGTGLGLAITRRIVEEHAGTITCRPADDADGGTVLEVVLPAAHPAQTTGSGHPTASGAASGDA